MELHDRPGTTKPEVGLLRGWGEVAARGTSKDIERAETPRTAPHDPSGSGRTWLDVASCVPIVATIIVPVCAPLPDVPRHLVEPPGATPFRAIPDVTGRLTAPVLIPLAPTPPFPVVPPGIGSATDPSPSLLPFELSRQTQASPLAVGLGIRPAHTDDGMISLVRGKLPATPDRLAPGSLIRWPVASTNRLYWALVTGWSAR